jgi:hypothetical protein
MKSSKPSGWDPRSGTVLTGTKRQLIVALIAMMATPMWFATGASATPTPPGGWNLDSCATGLLRPGGRTLGHDYRKRDVIGHGPCVNKVETYLRDWININKLFFPQTRGTWTRFTKDLTWTTNTTKALKQYYAAKHVLFPAHGFDWEELNEMYVECRSLATGVLQFQSAACPH